MVLTEMKDLKTKIVLHSELIKHVQWITQDLSVCMSNQHVRKTVYVV